MRIAQSKNNLKPTGVKDWLVYLFTGPFRWLLLAGLFGISLSAGFLYSWKFHPRAEIEAPIVPAATPTVMVPTPVTEKQEQIDPLPVIKLTVSEKDLSDTDNTNVTGKLVVNNGKAQTVKIRQLNESSSQESSLSLQLSNEIPELLVSGTSFLLMQAPADQAISVWLYAKQMRDAGIQVPEFVPVILSLNGAVESVYYLVQSAQADGIVFQLPESFYTVTIGDAAEQASILDDVAASAAVYQSSPDKTRLNLLLNDLSKLMKNPDQRFESFDGPTFSTYFAIHDVWAASYDDLALSPLYFYNFQTYQIEPAIATPTQITLSGEQAEKSFPFSNHPLYASTDLQIAYLSALTQLTTVETFETFTTAEYPGFQSYEKQLSEQLNMEPGTTWTLLNFRYQMMRLQVNPPYPVRGFVYTESPSECVNIDVVNLMVVPVDVESVSFLGTDLPLKTEWLQNPSGAAVLSANGERLQLKAYEGPDVFMSFCVPSVYFEQILTDQEQKDSLAEALTRENTWMINTKLSGEEKVYSTAMVPDVPAITTAAKRDMPSPLSIEQLTSMFPFLRVNQSGDDLTFIRGSWQVPTDIVIPAGVTVYFEAGCELNFSPNALLLSYSPFLAKGTESQLIIFTAAQNTWPGMIVINAGSESILEHVVVEKTAGIERGGWILTGGITFYRSPVTLQYSTLQDSNVEDAINVIRTTFTFDHLTIQRTPSDAFDSDFADGNIVHSHFEDIGGDAIDISGAYVDVVDSSMLNITDKGLSAGEDSHMTAENLSMENMGIGAAAKDLSTLTISDSVIRNARVAGLAAYIKKSIFGPSSIEATNVDILNTSNETLVQTYSTVTWNGKLQKTQELNVKTLYALGILGN